MGRFRSPDPGGRLAADPINPQSWNQYSYVWNNPVNFTDPSGMLPALGDGYVAAEFGADFSDSDPWGAGRGGSRLDGVVHFAEN